MFGLLGWLYSRVERVYLFFGSLYGKIRDAALYALKWAVREASRAFNAAKSYIIAAVNVVKVIFNLALEAIENFLVALVKTAFAFASYLFEVAKSIIEVSINATIGQLVRFIRQVDFDIRWWVATTEIKIRHFIQDLIRRINIEIGKLLIKWLMMEQMRAVFDRSGLAKMVDFFNRMYAFLDAFISAPLAFIMNMIGLVFMTFLEFILGYALQGPKYKLPPWPSWDEMEGHTGPGPKAPKGAGQIGSPLASLYITGYTYNNPPGHRGLDLGLVNGQSVFACHDGVVRAAGWSTVGYGYFIVLDSQTWWTRYAHAQQLNVRVNDRVDKGDIIGLGDDTGQSTGPHLHLEVKFRGSFVDPVTVLPI